MTPGVSLTDVSVKNYCPIEVTFFIHPEEVGRGGEYQTVLNYLTE